MSETNQSGGARAAERPGGGEPAVHPVAMPALDSQAPAAGAKGTAVQDANLGMILDIPVGITVELGSTRLSIQEILRLSAGSVIELNRLAGQPVDIMANGKLIGQGDVVVLEDTVGSRVTRLVGPEQRLKSL